MRRRAPATTISNDFRPNKTSIDFVSERYPNVNIETTAERFVDWASSDGAMYSDWQAAFRNVVRKGVENNWTSVVQFRKGTFNISPINKSMVTSEQREFTNLERLKERRAQIGLANFRDPLANESSQDYRNAQDVEWTNKVTKKLA